VFLYERFINFFALRCPYLKLSWCSFYNTYWYGHIICLVSCTKMILFQCSKRSRSGTYCQRSWSQWETGFEKTISESSQRYQLLLPTNWIKSPRKNKRKVWPTVSYRFMILQFSQSKKNLSAYAACGSNGNARHLLESFDG